MLTPRLTNALYYTTIPVLLDDIDETLARIANELYYNVIYYIYIVKSFIILLLD